ncbi:MAG: DUF58 domain-containing protein [Bacteroidales bacterium]|nr:DUF58 domain-containing protein [Bacteroidales bacterium]
MTGFSIDRNRLTQFGSLEFLARQIVEGFITGLHKSPFHGFSVEFAEHRLYNTGEPIRHIDWKLYGRTEKLFVKRYEEETNLRCQLVIDQSSSMCFPVRQKIDFEHPNKLFFSVYAAASLMELMRRQRDAVGLDLFDETIAFHEAAKSSAAHNKLVYSQLESLIANYDKTQKKTTSTTQCLHQIAEMTHRRSLVVIFTDLLDSLDDYNQLFEALEHLKFNKHEVILFHVYDGDLEQNLDFENRPYRFVDLETGDMLKLNPVEVQQRYRQLMAERKEAVLKHCYQYQIDYVEADINKDYNQILTSYLIKRSKML